ncbi:uncharacterized protein Dana_GF26807 [Drosophila ananassae]|uniref:FXNA-like protease n=1 Tax=Drosophila ananassae TaxID=7217 RepID=A0A0P8ZMZ1_DROAN|nr:endoplasmic reticulum metallopeptidase 1 [Drosophila ananassae]KPU76086.1 uncharacterized protein Dana_GF26807 [Drosophila ananassae]
MEEQDNKEVPLFEFLSLKRKKDDQKRMPWYYAPSFLLLWVALFYAIVIPLFNRLPDKVTISEESLRPGEFVGERAQKQLFDFDRIGVKYVGSTANEVKTVEFLVNEVEKIRSEMKSDLYDLDVDVQSSNGGYVLGRIRIYQGIQNVVVKLSSKNFPSDSYLLLNSHFDSKPSTPGSGDDGTMVVVMLEVLRQMAISETPFEHPIVFLFNGAEENGLMGSHAFITQHKWAANCKAYINLEVGGSGGRDLLFQSGPQHSWLMKYYKSYAKHPFATTLAEEIFQSGILPSDTDFRIFRDFGKIPGLDIAQAKNGYVYHTIFDTYQNVPGRSIQNTGNNILSLVQAFSNATELNEVEAYQNDGHSVFFDYLGLFFVYYTESTGIILNCIIGVLGLILVGWSLWRMSQKSEEVSLKQISIWFAIILVLHVIGVLLSICLPLLMAVMFDAGDRSLTYFTNNWLVLGLYICPAVIGLVLPLTLYYTLMPNRKLSYAYQIQMSLHAHLVLLTIIVFIATALGFRSEYSCLISLIFYSGALLINLLSKLHDKGFNWTLIVLCLQVFPFCYFYYLFYLLLVIFFPILGRSGSASNPDLIVALLCGCAVLSALGFSAQLINMFRWPKLILFGLGVVTFIFCMLAVSDVGFPYRAKTNVMRISCVHTRRIFYEYDGSVSHDDSGYYFNYQDRRGLNPLKDSALNLTGVVPVSSFCDDYVMCGVPCFAWCGWRERDGWLPRESEVIIPGEFYLKFLEKTVSEVNGTVRLSFQLYGAPHMNIFMQPVGSAVFRDWSFDRNMLDNPEKFELPYQVYLACGTDRSPLEFYIEMENPDKDYTVPVLELAVVGQFITYDYERDAESQRFVSEFPDFVHVTEWPAILKRYIF